MFNTTNILLPWQSEPHEGEDGMYFMPLCSLGLSKYSVNLLNGWVDGLNDFNMYSMGYVQGQKKF